MFCNKCEAFWKDAIDKAEVPETISSSADIHWEHHEVILHSSMRELKSSSDLGCIFCRCMYASPTKWELEDLLAKEEELHIVLEIKPSQGPPVISATFFEPSAEGKEPKVRLPKRMLASGASLLTDEEFSTTVERVMTLENRSTGSDAALELASFWLDRCLTTHDKCRISADAPFIPTRVVAVGASDDEIRLVETAKELQGEDADRRFVALSHCWGEVQIITTRNENYQDHLKNIKAAGTPGDSSDPGLSKTFREAIYTTRTLGYQYIWIDSLCIIQNNNDDWAAEAATMCDVYRYATFTIVAAHAPGGDVGCFEDRDGILQFPFYIEVPNASVAGHEPPNTPRILFDCYGRQQGGLGREPPLYGRSWVLQEQLLSPRMLIFDGSQLRWECNCMHGSERSPLGGISRHIGHHKSIRAGVMDDKDFFPLPDPTDPIPDFDARAQHLVWIFTIMDYTHRGMTKPKDRLVALHGISQALQRTTKYQYVAGLWKEQLWCGLLWSISHQKEFTSTTAGAFDVERLDSVRHEKPLAPSWSWASVTVPVVYLVPTILYYQPICEILDVSTSGTPDVQEGKIELRGHVRTGYVNSIYPYAIREAAKAYPNMAYVEPDGGKQLFTFRDRSFAPGDYFLFSPTRLSDSKNVTESSKWKMVRGTWRPDQVLDPLTEITFITIAQHNIGAVKGKATPIHNEKEPLNVFTIGLVPTGRAEGEYTRVGYCVWEACSWYGYLCGPVSRPGRDMEKADGWRAMLSRDPVYGAKASAKDVHAHEFEANELPKMANYHKSVLAEEKVVVVV